MTVTAINNNFVQNCAPLDEEDDQRTGLLLSSFSYGKDQCVKLTYDVYSLIETEDLRAQHTTRHVLSALTPLQTPSIEYRWNNKVNLKNKNYSNAFSMATLQVANPGYVLVSDDRTPLPNRAISKIGDEFLNTYRQYKIEEPALSEAQKIKKRVQLKSLANQNLNHAQEQLENVQNLSNSPLAGQSAHYSAFNLGTFQHFSLQIDHQTKNNNGSNVSLSFSHQQQVTAYGVWAHNFDSLQMLPQDALQRYQTTLTDAKTSLANNSLADVVTQTENLNQQSQDISWQPLSYRPLGAIIVIQETTQLSVQKNEFQFQFYHQLALPIQLMRDENGLSAMVALKAANSELQGFRPGLQHYIRLGYVKPKFSLSMSGGHMWEARTLFDLEHKDHHGIIDILLNLRLQSVGLLAQVSTIIDAGNIEYPMVQGAFGFLTQKISNKVSLSGYVSLGATTNYFLAGNGEKYGRYTLGLNGGF